MELFLSNQTFTFLEAFLLGTILAIIYDILREIRIKSKARIIGCAIYDLLFFIILIVLFFVFTVARSQGELRFFVVLAVTLGFILYFFTLSPYIRFILDKIFVSFINIKNFLLSFSNASISKIKLLYNKISNSILIKYKPKYKPIKLPKKKNKKKSSFFIKKDI